MTREEIIEGLYHIKNWECNGNAEMHKVVVAAIEVLDQEPVLDKIRAEIRNEQNMDYKCHRKTYDNCLRIIDKYKAESEDRNDD